MEEEEQDIPPKKKMDQGAKGSNQNQAGRGARHVAI
jgi:hypothetical protein